MDVPIFRLMKKLIEQFEIGFLDPLAIRVKDLDISVKRV